MITKIVVNLAYSRKWAKSFTGIALSERLDKRNGKLPLVIDFEKYHYRPQEQRYNSTPQPNLAEIIHNTEKNMGRYK